MGKSDEVIQLFNAYVMPTYSPNIVLERGKGTRVWDADGKVYLDFIAGIAVLNLGHSHPAVVEAIQEQAAKLTHVSNLYYTENQALLAYKLSTLSLGGKCFFCNSGAEANEGLIKLARLWGHEQEKYEVICMTNSFHGRTLATAAATGQEKIKKGFEPMPEGFWHTEFNDVDAARAMVTDNTAAVLLEVVQGEGGVIPAKEGFLRDMREMCDKESLLLLCDEVQSGMGRTGSWFAFQQEGVKPDAFSTAKALGNGFPVGAVVTGSRLSEVFSPGKHASTFGGTPLACAAALATIRAIEEEELVERARVKGEEMRRELARFADRFEHVVEARGRGMMLGLVLDQPAKPLVEQMREIGLLALATAENVIRLLPPLNVKDSEIEEALEIIDDCLTDWHEELAAEAAQSAVPVEEPAAPAAEEAEEAPAEEAPVEAAPAEAAPAEAAEEEAPAGPEAEAEDTARAGEEAPAGEPGEDKQA